MRQDKDSRLKTTDAVWTFTAGAITRFAELPVGHVLERVRVWLNANPEKHHAVKNIYEEGGGRLSSFYRGLIWNVLPAALKSGTRWVNTYASDKLLSPYIPNEYPVLKGAIIGLVSPAITTTLYCPFERLKVSSMTERGPASGSLKGAKGLMKGWRPMYVKEATISFLFNVAYAYFLQKAKAHRQRWPFESLHTAAIAAAAGTVCAVVTTPLDMVKDQMQMSRSLQEKRLIPAGLEIYKRYGLFSMVRAMPVKVARSAWYFAVTNLLMDHLKALPSFMRFDDSSPPKSPPSSTLR